MNQNMQLNTSSMIFKPLNRKECCTNFVDNEYTFNSVTFVQVQSTRLIGVFNDDTVKHEYN